MIDKMGLSTEGNPLDEVMFQHAMTAMFPSVKESTIQPWVDFVTEITVSGQYVDFREEPDLKTARAHWYDTLLAGFYRLKATHGEDIAAQTLELGHEGLCLYPYELEKAAERLSQGVSIETLGQLMRDGMLESETVEFPKLRDVLAADSPAQGPQMNMNL